MTSGDIAGESAYSLRDTFLKNSESELPTGDRTRWDE